MIIELKPDVVQEESVLLAQSRMNLADRIELEWYAGHRGTGGVTPGPICGASHESSLPQPTKDEKEDHGDNVHYQE